MHSPASIRSRIFTLLVISVLLAMLFTSRFYLRPSALGYGTHEQLGLPPCTFVALWSMRCPACGMTTSWAHATRGQWVSAWEANAGGALLALIAMAYIPVFCYYVLRGYWSRHGWLSLSLAVSLIVAVVSAAVQWIDRVWI